MYTLNIDYEQTKDCFAKFANVPSKLIWGDLSEVPSPWLSYIVPAYKRAYLLRETLESIIMQSPVSFDWDIVVVDNEAGEANETEEVIRSIGNCKILYYRNNINLGPDGNYNRCIELARGKWLAMCHADDLVTPDHLRSMSRYIEIASKGKKPLAYISVLYEEFTDSSTLPKKRKINLKFHKKYSFFNNDESKRYNNEPIEFTQIRALISGYSVSLPSFGTVMNKEVMLKTGGFNADIGICEDVITPYKLANSYGVYITPYVFGYYRFNDNETMKRSTILKICESIYDFREYMYSKNILCRVWGWIARDRQFELLRNYCINLSRHTGVSLKDSDFFYIHLLNNGVVSHIKKLLYKIITTIYLKDAFIYNDLCKIYIKSALPDLDKEMEKSKGEIVLYGAGGMGKIAVNFLRKKRPTYKIKCFAVTEKTGNDFLCGYPIHAIEDLRSERFNSIVFLTIITRQYQIEILKKLEEDGFPRIVSFDLS